MAVLVDDSTMQMHSYDTRAHAYVDHENAGGVGDGADRTEMVAV
jgi:hypothetical protein